MSKAFKAEDASAAPLIVPSRPPLPVGETNYVTVRSGRPCCVPSVKACCELGR